MQIRELRGFHCYDVFVFLFCQWLAFGAIAYEYFMP